MNNSKNYRAYFKTECGVWELSGFKSKITNFRPVVKAKKEIGVCPSNVKSRVKAYFTGVSKRPKLELFDLRGTPLQNKVWESLLGINWGKTVSYTQIAKKIGHPAAVRAVANAIGANPIAVLIPCHRVLGKDGSLTGYAYGLKKKLWLLMHEQRYNNRPWV